MLIPGRQQPQSFEQTYPTTLNTNYLLYLPKDYDEQQQKFWPLILFLHGAGERGHSLPLLGSQGLPKLLEECQEQGEDFPFVVVSPQCTENAWWDSAVLNTVLEEAVRTYRIDTQRIYVTGLSMGGYGTWALAIAYPHRFAAIAPICGGGDPSAVCSIKHLPIWNFHGAKDRIVPLEASEILVDTLRQCGGNVSFTIYPEAGHDSWTETYANPELYTWFLEHTRQDILFSHFR